MTEFPGILVQNHESHINLFKFHNDGGIDYNPVVCFCLRIFKNMHVSLWVNGLEILSQELQWVLSHTNNTLILWSQLMELLKQYSEDIPEVAIDIVSKNAKIADLVTKLGASTERESTVTILLLNNSTYFVCHLTVIDIKQIQLLLHFKYIVSPLLATWNYNSYSVSRVFECYRMSRSVFKLVTIVIV